MELTDSWSRACGADPAVVPLARLAALTARYELRETRNAAAVLAATAPDEFADLCAVLDSFSLEQADLTQPGGSESHLANRLNDAFRSRGWREGRVDTSVRSELKIQPYKPAGEEVVSERSSEVFNEGYKVDNVKGRVALDVEWNEKDGNLDRDIGAYRALYDTGLVDGAVLITRTHGELRALAYRLALAEGQTEKKARSRLATSTTTNLTKLAPRLTRGDGGGCPLLVVAICSRTLGEEPQRASVSDRSSSLRIAAQGSLLDPAED